MDKKKLAYKFYLRKDLSKTWLPYLLAIAIIEWVFWFYWDKSVYNSAKEIGNPIFLLMFVPVFGYMSGLFWKAIVIVMISLPIPTKKNDVNNLKVNRKVIITNALNFYMFFLFVIGGIFTIVAPISFLLLKPYAPAVFFLAFVLGLWSRKYSLE